MPDPKKKKQELPKKPIVVTDENDPRYKAYRDSLNLYNESLRDISYAKSKDSSGEAIDFFEDRYKVGEPRKNNRYPLSDSAEKSFLSLKKLNKKEPSPNKFNKVEYDGFLGLPGSSISLPIYKKPEQQVIIKDNKPKTLEEFKKKYPNAEKRFVRDDNGAENWATDPDAQYTSFINYPKKQEKKQVYSKDTPQVSNIPKLNPVGLQFINPILNTTIPNIPVQAKTPKSYSIQENINQNFGGHQINYKVDNIDLIPTNDLGPGNTRKITPQFAYGGNLNKNMNSNQLTEFNEGGLHHENPNGGIPVGDNNTVEQGESKIGNFVYSNRLYLDENIPKEMNLPNYIKNKSFAEASKLINNKFKDRNDKPSLETKKVLLDRLANAQETLKAQKEAELNKINEAFKINSQQPVDGEVPQGMEQFVPQNQMFLGGLFGQNEMGNLTGGNQGIASAAGPGAAMGAMSLYGLSQGVGASPNKNVTALNGVMQGAMTGSMFGPIGTGIGAIAGLGAGILGGNKAQREQARIAKNNAIMYNKGVSEEYAYGGKINMLSNGGSFGFQIPASSKRSDDPNYFKKDVVGSADYNTNIIQNLHDSLGITSDTPGYGSAWGQKSDNAFREWQKNNQPDKYVNNVKTFGKNYSLFNTPADNNTNTIGRGKVIAENYFNPKVGLKNKELMGLTPQGYKYNGAETPDTTGLVKPEVPFVEPTGVLQSMENYYKTSPNNINNVNNGIITPKKDYSQVGNDLLRMSPVLSNFMQLKGMKAPKAVSYAPLRNTLKYDPIDEARQEKIISQEANKQLNAITQAGGSQGAFRNAITSVGLNSMLARNAAAMNTESQNREQRLKIQDNQQRVNEYNNQMQNKAIDERRMDLGNYDTQKSKFIGQIGSDLGEIGKERAFATKAGQMFGYDENGKYLLGPNGTKVRIPFTDSTESTILTPQQKAYLATMPNMFGGYIINKKKK